MMGWASQMRRAERTALREVLNAQCEEIEHLVGLYNGREAPFCVPGDDSAHVLPNPARGRFFVLTSRDEIVGYSDDGDEIGMIPVPYVSCSVICINEPANRLIAPLSGFDDVIVFSLDRFPIGKWTRLTVKSGSFDKFPRFCVDQTTGNMASQRDDGTLTIFDRNFKLKHRSESDFKALYLHGDQCVGLHSIEIGTWADVRIKNWASGKPDTPSLAMARWNHVVAYDADSHCLISHDLDRRIYVQHIIADRNRRHWFSFSETLFPSGLLFCRRTNGGFRFYRIHDGGVIIVDREY